MDGTERAERYKNSTSFEVMTPISVFRLVVRNEDSYEKKAMQTE